MQLRKFSSRANLIVTDNSDKPDAAARAEVEAISNNLFSDEATTEATLAKVLKLEEALAKLLQCDRAVLVEAAKSSNSKFALKLIAICDTYFTSLDSAEKTFAATPGLEALCDSNDNTPLSLQARDLKTCLAFKKQIDAFKTSINNYLEKLRSALNALPKLSGNEETIVMGMYGMLGDQNEPLSMRLHQVTLRMSSVVQHCRLTDESKPLIDLCKAQQTLLNNIAFTSLTPVNSPRKIVI